MASRPPEWVADWVPLSTACTGWGGESDDRMCLAGASTEVGGPGAQGEDPRRELATVRARITKIDQKASVLLEGLSADTKGFVDAKLRDLGSERRRLQNRHDELETAPYDPIDAEAVLESGLASLDRLPRLLESGSLEDRKEFVRAFVSGVSVVPGEARLDVQMRRLPAVGELRAANSTCGLLAGARYEPLQIELRRVERFQAGLRGA
jgi:hypothetical protein